MKPKRSILLLFLALTCLSSCIKSGTVGQRHLIDFDWKFALGDFRDASKPGFDDSQWRKLDLPHDWSIEGIPDLKNPSGNDGGYFPTGIGWYRKSFKVPANWKKKLVSLYFEGVYMNSEVFINGHSLGIHPYGYSSFFYDLTPHLKIGSENVIAVRVDNSQQKNCRWYSGSGIYRHVWLQVSNTVHMAHWGVSIATLEADSSKSSIQVKTRVKNETGSSQKLSLITRLIDKNKKDLGNKVTNIEVQANSEVEATQDILVENPELWSPQTPDLYQAEIKVMSGSTVLDEINQSFGIRTISFSAESGFELNGQKMLLNGGCVHHDNGCLGAKAYNRAEERKVELLKAAGFNAVRTSHNPPSEAFLEACDRLGLLVIDEAFDGWRENKTPFDYALYFDQWWKRDLETMVLRDRNHPSIIMWSIGNEIIERTKPEAVETATRLAKAVRHIDPTRPITSAMTTWGQGWEIFDPLMAAHDVCGYNYQMHQALDDHERIPSRIIVHTESYPRDAFYCWDMADKHPYIIGDFVWTAIDYLGESGIGAYYYPGEEAVDHWINNRFPWHGAYCGDIDLTGWRKPISHYRSLLWNEEQALYLAVREPNPDQGEIKLTGWAVWPTWESWTWPGHEGKNIQVEICSKYPKVKLYLNDSLIGEQATTREQEFKATFALPYAPGVLKAVGIIDGKESDAVLLSTAQEASKINLKADRSEILADGQDLSFVTVEITDNANILDPNASHQLNFSIEGPGEIVGVDNANLKDTVPFVGNTRKAWKGRAMVVIKSTRASGTIRLKAQAPELAEAVLEIVVIK